MTASIWDDEELQAPPELAFVKLEKVGDGFSGIVVSVKKARFTDPDGDKVVPQIEFIDDAGGECRTWTAGQTDAKRQLAVARPGNRDHIVVRLTGVTNKFKHISVVVDRRAEQQTQTAPVVNLPTHQAPAPVGQSYQAPAPPAAFVSPREQQAPAPAAPQGYQPAPPPVYATNGGNGNGVTAPSTAPAAPPAEAIGPPPAGIDPMLWARMAPEQRALFPTTPPVATVQPAF